jgi:hypothetical protein
MRRSAAVWTQNASARFDLFVFTSAMDVYARPILRNLDPDNTIFKKHFYRESCTHTKVYYAVYMPTTVSLNHPGTLLQSYFFVKDLAVMGRDLSR